MKVLVFAVAVFGCSGGRAATPAPPVRNVDSAPAPTCAGAVCGAGEFCETRYKGHDSDPDGQPLDQTRCEPLPVACRVTPTCACVAAEVALTSCEVDRGLIVTDDTP